jgi:hypothetical protein
MRVNKGILSMMTISLLIFSNISILWVPLFQVSAEATGNIAGVIYDSGVDTDYDGTFDFLEVGVEVNVSTAGTFYMEVSGLYDSSYSYISVWNNTFTYLDVGAQVVYLSLDGPTIYASGFDPASVSDIYLYDEYYTWLGSLYDVPLSREYAYTEFDLPPALLTGVIYDSGVDNDSDGTFDFLEVGVEVNVTSPGMFRVEVPGLFDSGYNYISVWGGNFTYLDVGIQVVYLTLDGPTIYASGLNPSQVSSIYLYDEYYNQLGSLYNAPLSREYFYTEFDLPPAFLTGTIYDSGVDIDGDGAFDYLEVGVEVSVTDSGDYRVEISGLLDSGHDYIGVSSYESEHLDAGIQVVNVSLHGSTIYSSHFNPVNVSQITLYSVEFVPPYEYIGDWLGSVHDVPLSREYLYTEFDSPFKDMEAIFVVYPDGRVAMGGALNYTDMEPPNPYPSVHGVATVQKSGITTDVSASFILVIPPEEASQFPFNSSGFTLLSEYASDLLTTTISGSTVLPPSVASEFPFNITDFTVIGTYGSNLVNGNITVDAWNGFPLDDIMIDFQGNHTYVHLNGSASVIFGDYPSFGELNATVLEQLLADVTNTIGGQGPNSLYNMTKGLLELTMLNNVTTLHGSYATVDFEAKLEGDLIRTLVNMTGQPAYLCDGLNATWSSVESGSLVLTYTHALKQADMNLIFVANVTSLIDNMIPILPEMLPPEEAAFIESMLNTTYCTVDSAQVSVNYDNNQATITATATIQDLNAELNYMKSLLLAYNFSQPWASQLQTMNETQIDLADFSVSLNLTETSMEVDVSGFAVLAPLDWINATSFRLERFFNITASDYEPPSDREKLEVTVEGGSNATHTVTIIRSGTTPEPDISAPSGMTWYNQSISQLKDLIFQIGPRDNTPPNIGPSVQTPQIPDFDDAVTVSVNVTDAATGVRPDGVILSYRTNGGAWNNVTMSKTTGDTYEGIIPALPAGTHVEYMIIAYDYANNEAVDDSAGQYYVYTVIPEFPTWQMLALALLLTGLILAIMKRRRNITENNLTTHKLFSLFTIASQFFHSLNGAHTTLRWG